MLLLNVGPMQLGVSAHTSTHLYPSPTTQLSEGFLQIRDSIKALFPDRDCFPLVRPMSDEKALAKLETLDSSVMRPEFQQVGAACEFVHEHEACPILHLS